MADRMNMLAGQHVPRRGANRAHCRIMSRAFLALGLAGFAACAWSQALTDPTRPPPGYAETETGVSESVGGALVLQSVMISPTMKTAIISGEMVKLGGKIGNATLVRIGESEVVLKDGDEIQVLKMFPGVEKRQAIPAAPDDAGRRPAPARPPAADRG
jgi:MSHA biogenesis protein MshK